MSSDFKNSDILMYHEAKKPPSPVRVEEKLTNLERRTVAYPDVLFLGTDDTGMMGFELAKNVISKAFLFVIETLELSSNKRIDAYGQVGFVYTVDQNGNTSSNESFTARHNIVIDDDNYKFLMGCVTFDNDRYLMQFPDGGKVNDLVPYPLRQSSDESHHRNDVWKSGIDIIAGPVPSFVSLEQSFQMVREDFVLEKGQKIGIAVGMPPRDGVLSSLRRKYKQLDETWLDDIYGVSTMRSVNVYTGEITFVGDVHIEYNNNTFEGCSGAIVFLLDKHQPEESVKERDYGCAIAVHVGAHPHYDRNLAFVLPRLLPNSGSSK